MIDTPEGDALILWDTPGFGDSARLAKRLAQQGNPIGWFLSQVWDRFRDRAFWLSQQAVANVRDQADVVLYLVNASEAPEDAGYLAPEMAVLEWIGKPVIVLLNQTGRPRPRDEEAADEARWRNALGSASAGARRRLARCVRALLGAGDRVAAHHRERPFPKRSATRTRGSSLAWQGRRLAQFDEAMDALVAPIARAACDSEAVARRRPQGDAGRSRQGDRSSRQRRRRCEGQGEPRRSPRVSITTSATAPIG